MDCKGTLNFGKVALLAATLVIGMGIGIVGYQSSMVLESPATTTASVSIDTGQESVTVNVHDLGVYDKILIQHQSEETVVRHPQEQQVLYNSSDAPFTIEIIGVNDSGTTTIREVTVNEG